MTDNKHQPVQMPPLPPEIQASIERLRGLHKDRLHLIQAAEETKKDVCSIKPKKGTQPVFAFMPTELGRVAPFFPINRRDIKKFEYLREMPLGKPASWGNLTYSGPKLSTYDEDVLLAVTELIKKHKTLTIKTSKYELCQILGIARNSSQYASIWESLQRLKQASLTLVVKGKSQSITGMINDAYYAENGDFCIDISAFFLSVYLEGLISTIDMNFRNSLKGNIAKALYRFLRCHQGMQHDFHFMTIAQSINMNMTREHRKLKADIKAAFSELVKRKYLEKFTLEGETFSIYKKKSGVKKPAHLKA